MEEKSKKILYIITKSVWAGASKYVYDLAISLPQTKFRPIVAAGGNGELAQKIKQTSIPYFEIKNFQRDVSIFRDIFAFFEILFLLYKIKPDIIHVSSAKAGGIAGFGALFYKLLTFNFEILTVFTVHGWTFNENRPGWQIFLIKIFSRLTCFFYNKIICVSEYDKQTAVKNKICDPQKLVVIRNGIKQKEYDFLSREEARKKLSANNKLPAGDCFWVGTIGEFTANKGQKHLIETIRNFQSASWRTIFNFQCVIIGFGEEYDSLKLKIRKLELENKVFLIKNLPTAALYLKAFDVFVLPSIKEGLPYVLLEASLAGLPIITTNVGGIPEIIQNEKNGILIKPKNPEQITNALKKLLENPELKNKLGENARKQVLEKFGFKEMMEKTMKIYLQK